MVLGAVPQSLRKYLPLASGVKEVSPVGGSPLLIDWSLTLCKNWTLAIFLIKEVCRSSVGEVDFGEDGGQIGPGVSAVNSIQETGWCCLTESRGDENPVPDLVLEIGCEDRCARDFVGNGGKAMSVRLQEPTLAGRWGRSLIRPPDSFPRDLSSFPPRNVPGAVDPWVVGELAGSHNIDHCPCPSPW